MGVRFLLSLLLLATAAAAWAPLQRVGAQAERPAPDEPVAQAGSPTTTAQPRTATATTTVPTATSTVAQATTTVPTATAALATATSTATSTATQTPTGSPVLPLTSPSPSPEAAGRTVEVDGYVRVIDGRTIEARVDGARIGISVVGVDTAQGNTACGKDATARLEALVEDGIVLEEPPGPQYDERNLRRYIVRAKNGQSVAQDLVQSGVARASGEGRETASLRSAEATAPGGCNDLTPQPPLRRGEGVQSNRLPLSASERGSGGEVNPIQVNAVPIDFAQDVVARGFNRPTSFAFLPDGRILVAEKAGVVKIVVNGTTQSAPFLDISDQVNDYWDRGLLGLGVDPSFAQNGFVYLYYVYENDAGQYSGTKTARLSRFTASGNTASPSSESIILGRQNGATCNAMPAGADCIPADSYYHMGGGIRFTSEGHLVLTTGDGGSLNGSDDDPLRSQNLDLLAGKAVRITTGGQGVPDNPFWNGSASANRSKVWAYGLRNPFRFDLKPGTNVPYIGDVGSNRFEELDVAAKGANLGWPCYEGNERQSGYASRPVCQALYGQGESAVRFPLHTYANNPSGGGASIIGGIFYTATAFPSQYQGAYFFADYSRGTLRSITTDASDRLTSGPTDFASNTDFPVDVDLGPDGSIYYLPIYYGEIRRIRYTRAMDTTPPAITAISPQDGQTGIGVATTVTATFSEPMDPASLTTTSVTLTRQGTSSPVQATVTYDATSRTVTLDPAADLAPGATYLAAVTQGARDQAGNLLAQTRQWTFTTASVANQPPTITITAPTASQRFVVGDTISFAATATDPEDGPLSGNRVAWRVTLWHCPAFGSGCHPHPFQDVAGASGSFVWPSHGDGTYFEIEATATDSAGLTATATRRVDPRTVRLTLNTAPDGLQVGIDGTTQAAPLTITTIPGERHTITAPSPPGGQTFGSWSDGGAAEHAITVGSTDQTLTATFSGAGGPTPTPTPTPTATPGGTIPGPTSCPTGQFLVEYFPNKTLSGQPVFRACNFVLNWNWGEGSPGHGLDPDSFSIRWTGRYVFGAGNYTFFGNVDDGLRVWVDGAQIIDSWRPQSNTAIRAYRTMTAGEHEIKIEYFEGGGWANAYVAWGPTDTQGPTSCTSGGYLAEYFPNRTLGGTPAFRRCESWVGQSWEYGGPGGGLDPDNFSVRWTGRFSFAAGAYTFFASVDDGMRATVDGSPLLDEWRTQSYSEYRVNRSLAGGDHTIVVEYFEAGGWATAYFWWGPAS